VTDLPVQGSGHCIRLHVQADLAALNLLLLLKGRLIENSLLDQLEAIQASISR
jgi:hypothetical protein